MKTKILQTGLERFVDTYINENTDMCVKPSEEG